MVNGVGEEGCGCSDGVGCGCGGVGDCGCSNGVGCGCGSYGDAKTPKKSVLPIIVLGAGLLAIGYFFVKGAFE
jgi:hypothetical protein